MEESSQRLKAQAFIRKSRTKSKKSENKKTFNVTVIESSRF